MSMIGKLPFKPQNIAQVFVSFSGGKDSLAALLCACRVFERAQITALFLDTGAEAPETYEYLRLFHEVVFPVKRLAHRLIGVANGRNQLALIELDWRDVPGAHKALTLRDQIQQRYARRPDTGVWPSPRNRYCTKALKLQVVEKYIRGAVPDMAIRKKCVTVLGIRRAESKQRSATLEWSWNPELGINVWCPLIHWSTQDVFAYADQRGIPRNPIYERGHRANCVVCFFATEREIIAHEEAHPGILDEWIDLENNTGRTWKRNRSLRTLQQIAREEIPHQLILFEKVPGEELSCMSGFCDL